MSDIGSFGDLSSGLDPSQIFGDVGSVGDIGLPSGSVTAPTPAILPSNLGDPLGSLSSDISSLFKVVTSGQVAQTQAKAAASIAQSNALAAQARAANPLGAISPSVLLIGGGLLLTVLLLDRPQPAAAGRR